MTDELMQEASRLRNLISQLKMLLDRERTARLVWLPVSLTTSQEVWSNNVELLRPETLARIDDIVRGELTDALRIAQEQFDAL